MSNQRFLYCRDCSAAHHVTPFDTAPEFAVDGIEILEIPQDDRRIFLERHLRHRIGKLTGIDDERGDPDAIADPMSANHIEVTDGREFFAIRASRKSITEPMNYEVLPRQLRLWDTLDGAGEALKDASPRNPVRHSRTIIKRPGRTGRVAAELPGISGAL